MTRLFVAFTFTLFLALPVSAQDSLTKAHINEYMKLFRKSEKDAHKHLTSDTVYFICSSRNFPDHNYVEFFSLVKTKEPKVNGVIYQFYFLKDNLIFIIQGTRNRKYISRYYLNDGQVFSTELTKLLPVLSQEKINELKTRLISIRNSESR